MKPRKWLILDFCPFLNFLSKILFWTKKIIQCNCVDYEFIRHFFLYVHWKLIFETNTDTPKCWYSDSNDNFGFSGHHLCIIMNFPFFPISLSNLSTVFYQPKSRPFCILLTAITLFQDTIIHPWIILSLNSDHLFQEYPFAVSLQSYSKLFFCWFHPVSPYIIVITYKEPQNLFMSTHL